MIGEIRDLRTARNPPWLVWARRVIEPGDWVLPTCAEGFEQGGGVVGVRTQCYLASYWPTD